MKDDFFIGWAMPSKRTRRDFLALAAAATAVGGAAALGLGAASTPPGDGQWDGADVRSFAGMVSINPYPTLRTLDDFGQPRTYLLGSQAKCGVGARLAAFAGQSVRLRGSLVQRGKHGLIALADGPDWMEALQGAIDPRLAIPADTPLEAMSLEGEILDAKCWYGAMRPGHGKPHKACAALCIRSGLPPAFFAFRRDARLHPVLLTDAAGGSANSLVLPYVGEAVRVRGLLVQRGDILLLRLAASGGVAFL